MLEPVIDINTCNLCEGCIEVCPAVFYLNSDAGYVEVLDLAEYPQDEVDEAIKNCPMDCIVWE
jgi:ferredoxin